MIGVPMSEPKTPGLVIVNVPSCTSRGSSRLVRARFARSLSARVRPGERQVVRALDDGDDESPVERDRDADVDLLAIDDFVAAHRRVDDRVRLQPVDDRFQDERHVRELLAGRLLELGAILRANPRDAREVDLEERAHVRRRVPRRDHVLADQRAHLGHRLDDVARPRLGKRQRCRTWTRRAGADARRRRLARPTR